MFRSVVPVLHTPDIAGTIDFYEKVLGFSCVGRAGDDWCRLEREDAVIMYFNVEEFDVPHATATQYFYVDDLDRLWAAMKDHVTPEWGPMKMPYGMYEVGIKENNGYLLSFGQELKADLP